MINRIQFYTTSACQLKCTFCPKGFSNWDEYVYMNMETFKNYYNKMNNFIHDIPVELTPIVGDSLLDKHLIERIDYIRSKSNCTITIFTNLLNLTDEFIEKILVKTENINLNISILGYDKISYQQKTGLDLFHKFEEKLKMLNITNINVKNTIFCNYRYNNAKEIYKKNWINKDSLMFQLLILHNSSARINLPDEENCDDINWDEIYNVKTFEPIARNNCEVCSMLKCDVGIRPNGDVTICGDWFDVHGINKIGNINTDSCDKIFNINWKNIETEQKNGIYRGTCSVCSAVIQK